MYLANKPHDPQKLLETSFQVILFLDSRGFSSVLEGISRFCNILEPKPTKEPSCGLPKYVLDNQSFFRATSFSFLTWCISMSDSQPQTMHGPLKIPACLLNL